MREKFWNRVPVKIILIFIALLLPLCILMLYSSLSFIHALENEVMQNVNALLAVNSSNVHSEMQRTDYFLYQIQEWDADYLGLVYSKEKDLDYVKLSSLSTKLQEQISDMQYGQAIFFYLPEKDYLMLKYPNSLSDESDALKAYVKEKKPERAEIRWSLMKINGKIYYGHTMPYLSSCLGVFLDVDDMLEAVRKQVEYENCRVELEEKAAVSDKQYIAASTGFYHTGYFINVYISEKDMLGSLPAVTRILEAAVAAILLLIPVLLWVFWKIIVKPLNIIDAALVRMGSEPDYRIVPLKASREYVNLQNSLNHMADEIHSLKIESYEKELEFERMKTINLMLQIRPHFLLNTFNQIYSMAQLEDYESIQTMSMYLTKYFRYLFNLRALVPLREELWVVRAFLDSMEVCYIGCFLVEWDADENLGDEYMIPPLLLHNFVENIFKYAVAEGAVTTISVSIHRDIESDCVLITVEDDGPGMDPEILEKINAGEKVEKSDGKHIGIWNSAYRLKTFLGEKSRLEISSVLSEGTRVRIILPKQGEGEKGL